MVRVSPTEAVWPPTLKAIEPDELSPETATTDIADEPNETIAAVLCAEDEEITGLAEMDCSPAAKDAEAGA